MASIDDNSAEKLAQAIFDAHAKSGFKATSVMVFGVIPTGSNLLRFPKPIRHDLSDEKLKNPSKYTAAAQIQLSVLGRRTTIEQLIQILSQFRVGSLETDFFLMCEYVEELTTIHRSVQVIFEGVTFNVVYREHDEDWDGPMDDSSIKDVVPMGITFSYAFQKGYLVRAVKLAYGSHR